MHCDHRQLVTSSIAAHYAMLVTKIKSPQIQFYAQFLAVATETTQTKRVLAFITVETDEPLLNYAFVNIMISKLGNEHAEIKLIP